MRSAEQRWPALSNADDSASATTCSGSAELSTIIAFCPPVSAMSTGSSSRDSELPVDQAGDLRGAREDDARDARIGDERRANGLAAPRQQLQRGRGHAGTMEDARRPRARSAASARPASQAPDCRRRAPRATSPTKIASGKFHGEIATTGPSGATPAWSSSARACAA